jgi:hypothetical protein
MNLRGASPATACREEQVMKSLSHALLHRSPVAFHSKQIFETAGTGLKQTALKTDTAKFASYRIIGPTGAAIRLHMSPN